MSIEKMLLNAKEVDAFACLPDEQKAEADLLAEIAVNIHRKRIEMGMTQEQFAQFNHVSQTMVSKWESGECNFSIQSLIKLFNTIGLRLAVIPMESTERAKAAVFKSSSDEKWKYETTGGKRWTNSTYSPKAYNSAT